MLINVLPRKVKQKLCDFFLIYFKTPLDKIILKNYECCVHNSNSNVDYILSIVLCGSENFEQSCVAVKKAYNFLFFSKSCLNSCNAV